MPPTTRRGTVATVLAAVVILAALQSSPSSSTDNEEDRHRATLTVAWISESEEDAYIGRISVRYKIGDGPIVTEPAGERYRDMGNKHHAWVLELEDYEPGTALALQGDKSGTVKMRLHSKIVAGGVLVVGRSDKIFNGRVAARGVMNFTRAVYPGPDQNAWG